jgi:hypothetical protein
MLGTKRITAKAEPPMPVWEKDAEPMIPWSQFTSEYYRAPSNRGKSWHKARREASELYTDFKERRKGVKGPAPAPCDPNFETAIDDGSFTCARRVGKAYPFEENRATLRKLRDEQKVAAARLQAETNRLHVKYEAAQAEAKQAAIKHRRVVKELGAERSEHLIQLKQERDNWELHAASMKEAHDKSRHTMHLELSKARIATRLLQAKVQKLEKRHVEEKEAFRRKLQAAQIQQRQSHVTLVDDVRARNDDELARQLQVSRESERALQAHLADVQKQLVDASSSERRSLEQVREELKEAQIQQAALSKQLAKQQEEASAAVARFEAEQAPLVKELAENRTRIAKMQTSKVFTDAALSALRKKYEDSEAKLANALAREAAYHLARADTSFAVAQSDALYAEPAVLTQQLEEARLRIAELDKRSSVDSNELNKAKQAFEVLQVQHQTLRNASAAAQAASEKLQTKYEALRASMTSTANARVVAASADEELHAELRQQISETDEKLKNSRADAQAYHAQYEALLKANVTATEADDALHKELRAKISETEAELATALERAENREGRIKILDGQLAEARKDLAASEARVNSLAASGTQQSLAAATRAADAQRELVSQLETARSEREAARTELETTKAALSKANIEIAELKATAKAYTHETERLLADAKEAHRVQLAEVEGKLKVSQERANDLDAKLQAAQARATELEAKAANADQLGLTARNKVQQYLERANANRGFC